MSQSEAEARSQQHAGHSIRPLPAPVAAQIKSATVIVSLAQVVLELLKNALDATASRIEATVDLTRGGCTVEDDGVGIPPHEFYEQGGLAKFYCTSKYHAPEALLGRKGTFLASLAAVSLLTITSHHHQHHSHNSLTIHQANVIARQCPAPAHSQVHSKHGTRVTVRNLFGNLPVRVKQRTAMLEQKAEQVRLWDALKRDIVGLLLSWQGAVSLRVRDMSGKTIIKINATSPTAAIQTGRHADIEPRSARLTATLNVLTQADYISVDAWPSWVPVAASTSFVSIQGAISLDPAPTKQTQFLSLGHQPILSASGHNKLYDEINRLFSFSGFGTVEETPEVHNYVDMYFQTDNENKSNGPTNRQLKTRKSIDKHPMFHMRIILNDRPSNHCVSELGNERTMQATLDILRAMVTQWLSTHHFRPQLRRGKRDRPTTPVSDYRSSATYNTSPNAEPFVGPLQSHTKFPLAESLIPKSGKRICLQPLTSSQPLNKSHSSVFAQWSRIKSGKVDFFNEKPSPTGPNTKSKVIGTMRSQSLQSFTPLSSKNFAAFEIEPIPRGALNLGTTGEAYDNETSKLQSFQTPNDDTVLWTDPSTKKSYVLNARTGCVVPDLRSRPNTVSTSTDQFLSQKTIGRPLRLARRPTTASKAEKPWLTNLLHSWENPVFQLNERRVQHVGLHKPGLDDSPHQHHCSQIDMDKALNNLAASGTSGKLSKSDLQHAEIIAQVDRKFVLAKMKCRSSLPPSVGEPSELLVLIDQHAADERIQVEHLLQKLCSPITGEIGLLEYTSNLGHRSQVASKLLDKPLQFSISQIECNHFTIHAARFAAWGILFDISDAKPTRNHPGGSNDKPQSLLSVKSLPPAIFERCKTDPKVLISLLRSTVWKYVEDLHLPPLSSHSVTSNSPILTHNSQEDSEWVRRLVTCPPGLVDLINSRACRSAIMFNDELDIEQCKQLVHRLADCVFPFMCAHGRPSMVPLVSLGQLGDGSPQSFTGPGLGEWEEDGFLAAWKA